LTIIWVKSKDLVVKDGGIIYHRIKNKRIFIQTKPNCIWINFNIVNQESRDLNIFRPRKNRTFRRKMIR
ncbi:uncharacterized protein METZ01_LOCUS320829, partial [marine metagenome]